MFADSSLYRPPPFPMIAVTLSCDLEGRNSAACIHLCSSTFFLRSTQRGIERLVTTKELRLPVRLGMGRNEECAKQGSEGRRN